MEVEEVMQVVEEVFKEMVAANRLAETITVCELRPERQRKHTRRRW